MSGIGWQDIMHLFFIVYVFTKYLQYRQAWIKFKVTAWIKCLGLWIIYSKEIAIKIVWHDMIVLDLGVVGPKNIDETCMNKC